MYRRVKTIEAQVNIKKRKTVKDKYTRNSSYKKKRNRKKPMDLVKRLR